MSVSSPLQQWEPMNSTVRFRRQDEPVRVRCSVTEKQAVHWAFPSAVKPVVTSICAGDTRLNVLVGDARLRSADDCTLVCSVVF